MLSYTEVKPGVVVVIDGEPFQKPHNTAKMRSLLSGSTVERVFTQADKIVEAEIETREIQFVYANRGEVIFADPKNPKDRFPLSADIIGSALDYIREKDIVEARVFNDEIFGLRIPIKVELEVTEAPPNIRGNTSSGGNKVTLETGLTVTTPLFIEVGDVIRVNTETGTYVERV